MSRDSLKKHMRLHKPQPISSEERVEIERPECNNLYTVITVRETTAMTIATTSNRL